MVTALLIQSNILLESKNTRYCGGTVKCFGCSGTPFSIGGIRFSLAKSHFFAAARRKGGPPAAGGSAPPAAALHRAPIWGLRPNPLDFGPFRANPLDFFGPPPWPPPPGGCQHVIVNPSKGLDTLFRTQM